MPEETLALEFNTISLWELALFIFSIGFFVLCVYLAFSLVRRVGKSITRVNRILDDVEQRTGPLLDNLNTTVENVNVTLVQVEGELEKVGSITGNASQISSNVANISTLIAAAVASPLVKVAALGFGLRSAVKKRGQEADEEQVRRMVDASKQSRKERKRAAKARKRQK